jgi:hypothetical protein
LAGDDRNEESVRARQNSETDVHHLKNIKHLYKTERLYVFTYKRM